MKPIHLISAALLAMTLGGCAGSVSEPVAVEPLTADQQASLHVSDITADAADGVQMSDGDFGLICQKVRSYIQAGSPDVLTDPAGAQPLKMNIHFTEFDRGNAFARFMLIGLGQIKIDATVQLEDSSGKVVASYDVSKDFALGGVAGGTTTVEDVEEGFAKSVASVVAKKTT